MHQHPRCGVICSSPSSVDNHQGKKTPSLGQLKLVAGLCPARSRAGPLGDAHLGVARGEGRARRGAACSRTRASPRSHQPGAAGPLPPAGWITKTSLHSEEPFCLLVPFCLGHGPRPAHAASRCAQGLTLGSCSVSPAGPSGRGGDTGSRRQGGMGPDRGATRVLQRMGGVLRRPEAPPRTGHVPWEGAGTGRPPAAHGTRGARRPRSLPRRGSGGLRQRRQLGTGGGRLSPTPARPRRGSPRSPCRRRRGTARGRRARPGAARGGPCRAVPGRAPAGP